MIEKCQSFKTSDGEIHSSIEVAQKHELSKFLESLEIGASDDESKIAELLIGNKDKIVDLLTMKASSKPKARKVNGGTKTRKPKGENTTADGAPNLG